MTEYLLHLGAQLEDYRLIARRHPWKYLVGKTKSAEEHSSP